MAPLLFVLVGVFVALWPRPATAAEEACASFPAGSLAQTECTYVQTKLQEQKAMEASRSQSGDPSVEAADRFRCPDETAEEIRDLQGRPGEVVRGTYRNVGPKAVAEVIVGFALFNAQNQPVKTIEAAVLPRTIPPGGSGTFAVEVPAPARLGWTCFRFEITGLPE